MSGGLQTPQSRLSRHLSAAQIRGVERLGQAMLPGGEGFPSFTALGCARHIDRILDFMPERDIKDLKLLLSLLAVMPLAFARFFAWILERGLAWPGPVGAQLRTIRLGVRGLVFSLYYGDPAVLKEIGYEVGVYVD